jgi:hypothetical protein
MQKLTRIAFYLTGVAAARAAQAADGTRKAEFVHRLIVDLMRYDRCLTTTAAKSFPDSNIQLFICRSAHLDTQCGRVSPGLPAGN